MCLLFRLLHEGDKAPSMTPHGQLSWINALPGVLWE